MGPNDAAILVRGPSQSPPVLIWCGAVRWRRRPPHPGARAVASWRGGGARR